MALTPSIHDSQGAALGVVKSVTPSEHLSQARTLGIYNVPTTSMHAQQAKSLAVYNGTTPIHAQQAAVLAVCRGRIDNFNMRAYTVTIDGHDWYILQLGEEGTLVYDTTTQQWMQWGSDNSDLPNFRADTGLNWNAVSNYGTNSDVVLGDNLTGMLYYFNPGQNYDGDAYDPKSTAVYKFTRALTGGIPNRGRGNIPCNFVFLTGDAGYGLLGSTVTLNVSDDLGQTYVNCGSLPATTDYSQDVTWYSLGSFGAPGRIFTISDDGAFERIDSLDMN